MRGRLAAILAATAIGSALTAGCGSSSGGSAAPAPSGMIGVILPDTTSSARWANADAPFLKAAFAKAGIASDVENAEGSTVRFEQLAQKMINQEDVKVLMITSLDATSGTTVIKQAAAAGIPVIDYDRLTLGGGAKYYVSFDNVAVGTAIGQGVVAGLKAKGKATGKVVELNGSPTDNNATLFWQGYDKVVRDAGYTVAASAAVPAWDNGRAVGVFRSELAQVGGSVDGVVAANDGLAGAVIGVLGPLGLAGKVPVTGQDATDAGLQRILLGTQTMTVYKAIKKEAAAAAQLGIALIEDKVTEADTLAAGVVQDPTTGIDVKSVLLTPEAIYQRTVKDVVADGYTTAAKVCATPQLRTACATYGVH